LEKKGRAWFSFRLFEVLFPSRVSGFNTSMLFFPLQRRSMTPANNSRPRTSKISSFFRIDLS